MALSLKEISLGACPDKYDLRFPGTVYKQEIPANMAFAMPVPCPFQWVVQPFRTKRDIIGVKAQDPERTPTAPASSTGAAGPL